MTESCFSRPEGRTPRSSPSWYGSVWGDASPPKHGSSGAASSSGTIIMLFLLMKLLASLRFSQLDEPSKLRPVTLSSRFLFFSRLSPAWVGYEPFLVHLSNSSRNLADSLVFSRSARFFCLQSTTACRQLVMTYSLYFLISASYVLNIISFWVFRSISSVKSVASACSLPIFSSVTLISWSSTSAFFFSV